jgi:hypothetical protein
MKYLFVTLCLSLATQNAVAFPRGSPQSRGLVDNIFSTIVGLVQEIVQAAGSGSKDLNAKTPFDAKSQLVDTTGVHAVFPILDKLTHPDELTSISVSSTWT